MSSDLLLTGLVLLAAGAFAWWYLRRTEQQREEREEQRQAEEAAKLSAESGLPIGERPIIVDELARAILDDGLAHNSKWVDSEFRSAYWSKMDAGAGMAEAFRAAMEARRWRSGSQGQVFDRLLSHGLIDETTRDQWKASAEARFPSGYGRAP